MKLTEELPNPAGFNDGVGDNIVLSLGAGTRDRVLPFGGPRDEVG
jgi:hypothetical protein